MRKSYLLYTGLGLSILLWVLNSLALERSLYWSLGWYDVMMHFLAGFVLGLAGYWLLFKSGLFFSSFYKPAFMIFVVFVAVFILGVAWEVFEIIFYNFIAQNPFDILDTISDVCFDLAGGAFALLYFFIHIMLISKNEVQLP